eukprot:scaffold155_cov347-Pavlova_lutheri.AAC.49
MAHVSFVVQVANSILERKSHSFGRSSKTMCILFGQAPIVLGHKGQGVAMGSKQTGFRSTCFKPRVCEGSFGSLL